MFSGEIKNVIISIDWHTKGRIYYKKTHLQNQGHKVFGEN